MRGLAATLLGSLLFVSAAQALPMPDSTIEEPNQLEQQIQPSERNFFAETQVFCMTLALFFEGGSTNEPEEGLRHIARVIAERARADRWYWGGKTLCGVVFFQKGKVCQFSFACLPLARRTPYKSRMWEKSREIAIEQVDGRNTGPDYTIRYYMNESLSQLKHACMFRKEFIPVVQAGTHEFFREASYEEKRELRKTNPAICQKYAESLKPKKKKKTKVAAKAKPSTVAASSAPAAEPRKEASVASE